ncbi:multiple cyclophane-containing RiPP AmcA [Actinoplanes sp. DH11]|uniref:multiple cyclophane-containing RiPP AmcA n=1 Tax=Actinoplanes sp. DH11 TaxID=2857011 RepID=UPI001E4B9335|nr:multiple cyclophane-containing RiPP AmcA [Actinoplanes sp. DH11]
MPEITRPRLSDDVETDPVTARVHDTRAGLSALIAEAEAARQKRDEQASQDDGSAVCAWNHFENIPTFYNWNNRPR